MGGMCKSVWGDHTPGICVIPPSNVFVLYRKSIQLNPIITAYPASSRLFSRATGACVLCIKCSQRLKLLLMIGGYKYILGKLYIVPGKVIGRAPGGFLLIYHRLRQCTRRKTIPLRRKQQTLMLIIDHSMTRQLRNSHGLENDAHICRLDCGRCRCVHYRYCNISYMCSMHSSLQNYLSRVFSDHAHSSSCLSHHLPLI